MNSIRFEAVIGQDRVIHVPSDVDVPQGTVEVTVRKNVEPEKSKNTEPLGNSRAWLLKIIREIEREAPSLPCDLAERHDFYAHGKPRE